MDEHPVTPEPWIVGVRFRPAGQIYDFDPGPLTLRVEDRVLVETDRGLALGTVVVAPHRRRTSRALHRVVKKADARDLAREDRNLQREREVYRTALTRVREHDLPLKIVKAENSFDGTRITFFYTAEDRVDFRALVHELADALRARIDMKQIGARDETKITGGVGVCGRELCCASWLREFQAITVKMVKEQGLSLNPSKLAGQCGRLKCCLRYEYATYQELRRVLPKVGARVQSVKGDGQVVRQNILKQTVVIRRHDDGVEAEATLEDLVVPRADA